MKITELISTLQHIHASQGEMQVVLQDSPPNTHPECCKHESFFIVEEPLDERDGPNDFRMETVLRTWPY